MKSLIVFDLDGTLALSKSAIDDEMASLLGQLLEVEKVAIISGGDYPQFEQQVLGHLRGGDLVKLSILPTSGTKFFTYDGEWHKLYSEDLTADEKRKIEDALNHHFHVVARVLTIHGDPEQIPRAGNFNATARAHRVWRGYHTTHAERSADWPSPNRLEEERCPWGMALKPVPPPDA